MTHPNKPLKMLAHPVASVIRSRPSVRGSLVIVKWLETDSRLPVWVWIIVSFANWILSWLFWATHTKARAQ